MFLVFLTTVAHRRRRVQYIARESDQVCAGGRTAPHKGHSVNHAREDPVNGFYRPITSAGGIVWPYLVPACGAIIGGTMTIVQRVLLSQTWRAPGCRMGELWILGERHPPGWNRAWGEPTGS